MRLKEGKTREPRCARAPRVLCVGETGACCPQVAAHRSSAAEAAPFVAHCRALIARYPPLDALLDDGEGRGCVSVAKRRPQKSRSLSPRSLSDDAGERERPEERTMQFGMIPKTVLS